MESIETCTAFALRQVTEVVTTDTRGKVPPITADTALRDLFLDSMDRTQLFLLLNSEGHTLAESQFNAARTVGEIAEELRIR